MSDFFEFHEDPNEQKKKLKDRPMRVGVVGSQLYENKVKIKDVIFKMKNKFNQDKKEFLVISGGRTNGADKYVKKFSLEFGVNYKEFNPAHTVHNLYSMLHENFYSKKYSPAYFFQRNQMMVDYCDYLIVFKKNEQNDEIDSVVELAKKHNKPIKIIY